MDAFSVQDDQPDRGERCGLHAFEGQSPFQDEGMKKIAALKDIFGMEYGASASHHFAGETTASGRF